MTAFLGLIVLKISMDLSRLSPHHIEITIITTITIIMTITITTISTTTAIADDTITTTIN